MVRILAVTGWDRSGSTLIANALGSLPGAISVGEVVNIWGRGIIQNRSCACGERFDSCGFWAPIVRRAYGDDPDQALEVARTLPWLRNRSLVFRQIPGFARYDEERSRGYEQALGRVYDAVIEQSGAELIVDASKTPWHTDALTRLPTLLRRDDVEVSVLHVVRDPRAVAFSMRKEVEYDADGDRALMMDRHNAVRSTLSWAGRNRLTEHMWRRSESYMRLRYEDFAADPAAAMHRLVSFVGLDVDSADAGCDWVTVGESHSVSGNPMRFQSGVVKVRLDDRWRTESGSLQSALVRVSALGHMRRYGYR